MTDDELERALIALPLEEPPADLRRRILVSTVYRPRLAVPAWEVWTAGTLSALVVWLAYLVLTGIPRAGRDAVHALAASLDHLGLAVGAPTLLWTILGISSAVWISQLSLPRRELRPGQ
jgi:hypothetical protein